MAAAKTISSDADDLQSDMSAYFLDNHRTHTSTRQVRVLIQVVVSDSQAPKPAREAGVRNPTFVTSLVGPLPGTSEVCTL